MGTNSAFCKIIAIAGPTASGKSHLANELSNSIGKSKSAILHQDNYYKNFSNFNKTNRKKINFDDIRSFDSNLLANHLARLNNGKLVSAPVYDFVQSRRLKKTNKIDSRQVIIVEGLMPFINRRLRGLFDYKIYIKADSYLCFARRLRRDTKERGDSIESVCKRYLKDVLPMQKKYVEPQMKWADMVVDGNKEFNRKVIEKIVRECRVHKCRSVGLRELK